MITRIWNASTKTETVIKAPDDKNTVPVPITPTETEAMQSDIVALKTRLAKIEAVPIVKATLEPITIVSK